MENVCCVPIYLSPKEIQTTVNCLLAKQRRREKDVLKAKANPPKNPHAVPCIQGHADRLKAAADAIVSQARGQGLLVSTDGGPHGE